MNYVIEVMWIVEKDVLGFSEWIIIVVGAGVPLRGVCEFVWCE